MSKIDDISGKKFNKLTVIERMKSSKSGKAMWKCRCDCGNYTIVSGSNLKTGGVKSCGCLKELVQQSVHANADVPSSIASDQSSSHALWNANPANSAAQHDSTASAPTTGEVSWKDLSRKIQNTEKEAIIQALLQTNGNKAKAARLLNIDRSSLYYKLKKYNITE